MKYISYTSHNVKKLIDYLSCNSNVTQTFLLYQISLFPEKDNSLFPSIYIYFIKILQKNCVFCIVKIYLIQ